MLQPQISYAPFNINYASYENLHWMGFIRRYFTIVYSILESLIKNLKPVKSFSKVMKIGWSQEANY